MKRITSAAALVAATGLALAGCGGSSGGNGAAASNSNSAAPSTSPSTSTSAGASPSASGAALPKLDGKTIEVAAEWQQTEEQSFKKVIDGFEQATGAKVQYTSTGNNTATILGTRVAGGNPPDVALIPQPGLIKQFVAKGAVKPLPAAVQSVVQQNFASTWQDLGTFSGKMYAVWYKAANKSTVWYRTDAFDQAGIQPPQTWDDFVKGLQTLRDAGVTPLSIGGGDGWTLTDWFENVYIRSAGADKYDQLTAHKIPWTDPSVKTALQTLGSLWKQKDLIAGNPQQATFPVSVTNVFGSKKGAVVYEGDFVAGVISGSTKAKVGTDAKFFGFPNINNAPASVIGGGDAAVMMKDSPAAEAFIQYLAGAQSADIWVKLGGFTSPNKAVPLADYPDDISRQIAQQLVSAQVFRFDMSDQTPAQFGGTPGQGEWKDLQDFLANPTNVNGTAQKLEADAKAAYKS